MPARRSPDITMAAPMFSEARTLIASSTDCSGVTLMTARVGFVRRSSATVFIANLLHVRIVRSAATFGDHPLDVLLRVLDVAGLAVHAILGVDLEAGVAALRHEFVHPSRTVARLGPVVNGQVDADRD